MPQKYFNGKPIAYNISYYTDGLERNLSFVTVDHMTNSSELGNLTVFTVYVITAVAPQLLTTSNFIGPWYHAALLFSGLGSTVLLFGVLFSQQIREDLVRAVSVVSSGGVGPGNSTTARTDSDGRF